MPIKIQEILKICKSSNKWRNCVVVPTSIIQSLSDDEDGWYNTTASGC